MSGRKIPFWKLGRHLRDAGRDLSKSAGRHIQQRFGQVRETARNAGRRMARHALAVQDGARLPNHLVERSARSVTEDRRYEALPSNVQWRAGYADVMRYELGLGAEADRDGGHGPRADLEAGQ